MPVITRSMAKLAQAQIKAADSAVVENNGSISIKEHLQVLKKPKLLEESTNGTLPKIRKRGRGRPKALKNNPKIKPIPEEPFDEVIEENGGAEENYETVVRRNAQKVVMPENEHDQFPVLPVALSINLVKLKKAKQSKPILPKEPAPAVACSSKSALCKTPFTETPIRTGLKRSTPRKLTFDLDLDESENIESTFLFENSQDLSPDYDITTYDELESNGEDDLLYRCDKHVPEWSQNKELLVESLCSMIPIQNSKILTTFPTARPWPLKFADPESLISECDSSSSLSSGTSS